MELQTHTDCIVNKKHSCNLMTVYRSGVCDALQDVRDVLIQVFPDNINLKIISLWSLTDVEIMKSLLENE